MAFLEKKKQKEYKVRMISDTRGYPDGITSVLYKKNEIYVVSESLFKGFISLAACELVEEEKITLPDLYVSPEIINPVQETTVDIPVLEIKKAKKKAKK